MRSIKYWVLRLRRRSPMCERIKLSSMIVERLSSQGNDHSPMIYLGISGRTSNNLFGCMNLTTLIGVHKICHCRDLRVALIPEWARLESTQTSKEEKPTAWSPGCRRDWPRFLWACSPARDTWALECAAVDRPHRSCGKIRKSLRLLDSIGLSNAFNQSNLMRWCD